MLYIFINPLTGATMRSSGHARNPVARSLGIMTEGYGGKLHEPWMLQSIWIGADCVFAVDPAVIHAVREAE